MKKLITLFTIQLILAASMLFAKEVTISVGAGECWKQKSEPQFALWIEDENGNFIKTLYVTQRAGKKKWRMAPKDGRPESLPVWYHKSQNEISKTEPELDAVTSATPKGGIIFSAETGSKNCRICAEFNTSFDYNETFTKKNSGVNGQPSVIYQAELPADFSDEILLKLTGTGSLDGSNGEIHPVPETLTTAHKIVKAVAVKAVN
ncbi:MAG: DUF2271 domain-containing protein [Treponema sp.]|nr:DUF2271 domain-containing protein [Treponema sp.]